jgi:heat-inducible transcriptional repressor
MISQRQEKLLDFVIREYISTAEPVSSKALKKICDLDVCGATIRNDLQSLTEAGYIEQPHTSAGRVPTKKAYKHFVSLRDISRREIDKTDKEEQNQFDDFIVRQIQTAHQQIQEEMRLAEELMKSLSKTSMTLNYTRITKTDNLLEILEILGPSKTAHNENITIITKIIKQLEQF